MLAIFGAIFLRIRGLCATVEVGGGDDGGAGRETYVEGTTIGGGTGGGGSSLISSTTGVGSKIIDFYFE